uniref:Uncharacterized protein n=1 Tax=Acrobeloides nanus TaxID=290746 RepID=A0A914BWJ8_9BILA
MIAFTWQHFLDDPSKPEWLLRFPMVKASLRAMDTITAFVSQDLPELGCQLDHYVVAGASKRGWTTWLVGAVDQTRVKAIVPIVLDAINFVAVMHHQYRSYGGWSFALVDYIDSLEIPITSRFDDPNMITMQQYIDPYFYIDRLTMPKLIVNAGMDEFQQPDDTHYWWKDMPEPKHFLMVPNAEHTMISGVLEIIPAIGAFVVAQFSGQPVPIVTWTRDDDTGLIVATVENDASVHSVNAWYSYSCGRNSWDNVTRRDFRIANYDDPCECGIGYAPYCANLVVLWDVKQLQPTIVNGKRTYSVSPSDLEELKTGQWVTYMIDFKFDDPHGLGYDTMKELKKMTKKPSNKVKPNVYFGGIPEDLGGYFQFTTEVAVWPNKFPYTDCHGSTCGSKMV